MAHYDSSDEFENILLFKSDIKLSQKSQVFTPERTSLVMFLLILNVTNNCIELRMTIRESSISFLPTEPPTNKLLFRQCICEGPF